MSFRLGHLSCSPRAFWRKNENLSTRPPVAIHFFFRFRLMWVESTVHVGQFELAKTLVPRLTDAAIKAEEMQMRTRFIYRFHDGRS